MHRASLKTFSFYPGSNGEKFESDPLFLNDILYAPNVVTDNLENEIETKNEKECVCTVKEIKPL